LPRWEQDERALGPVVQGFTARGFSINGGSYEGATLTPERVEEWAPPPLSELGIEHLESLLGGAEPPEFLILGTGRTMAFPPRALVQALEARGIGVEAMDSRAAARTWGMLRSEGRRIVAALMPLA
jgi:uncharacterized protein